MNKIKKFDQEQLTFIVNTILSAAIDRIEVLPDNTDWFYASIETAGVALATLYYQLTGNCLAIQDAIEISGLEKIALKAKKLALKNDFGSVSTTKNSEMFVKKNFSTYLAA